MCSVKQQQQGKVHPVRLALGHDEYMIRRRQRPAARRDPSLSGFLFLPTLTLLGPQLKWPLVTRLLGLGRLAVTSCPACQFDGEVRKGARKNPEPAPVGIPEYASGHAWAT